MKKLAAIFTFLLAFSLSANAQQSGMSADEAAKKDVSELHQVVTLTDSQQQNLVPLFKMKHETMQDATISAERKKEMSRAVASKISSTIDDKQQEKLNSNPELLERLTK